MPNSLEDKVSQLKNEVAQIKSSQILGGDNSRVYRHYVEWSFSPVYANSNGYYYFSTSYGASSSDRCEIVNEDDDPFALVSIEKIELRRRGKIISGWSNYAQFSNMNLSGFGQISSTGDMLSASISQNTALYLKSPPLGTKIIFTLNVGRVGTLTDNPSTPFTYELRVWLKSTSPSLYIAREADQ